MALFFLRFFFKTFNFLSKISIVLVLRWFRPTSRFEHMVVRALIFSISQLIGLWMGIELAFIVYIAGGGHSTLKVISMKVLTSWLIIYAFKDLNVGVLLVIVSALFKDSCLKLKSLLKGNHFKVRRGTVGQIVVEDMDAVLVPGITVLLVTLVCFLIYFRHRLSNKLRTLVSEGMEKTQLRVAGQQSNPLFKAFMGCIVEIAVIMSVKTQDSRVTSHIVASAMGRVWAYNLIEHVVPVCVQDFIEAFPLQKVIIGMHCKPFGG